MSDIRTYMTQRHRHCDDEFTRAEDLVSDGNWEEGAACWHQFADSLEHHLCQEELLLFPEFEAHTGSNAGPTAVMRMEHEQMRALVRDLNDAVAAAEQSRFLGLSETLMVLMQQHNMKEEQILYPMSDQLPLDSAGMVTKLEAFR